MFQEDSILPDRARSGPARPVEPGLAVRGDASLRRPYGCLSRKYMSVRSFSRSWSDTIIFLPSADTLMS